MATPLPVIAQTFRVALRWLYAPKSQTAVNVMHIAADSAGKTALEVFTCLDAHVTANMWDGVASGSHVEEVDITPLDGTTATQSFLTSSPAKWSGVNATDAIPAVAILVKEVTLFRGRNKRGRLFLPFCAEGVSETGFINGGSQATMQAAWTAFLAAIDGDGTTPMNMTVASYDRKHGGAGAGGTAVDHVVIETALGTQRKRQERNR